MEIRGTKNAGKKGVFWDLILLDIPVALVMGMVLVSAALCLMHSL